MDGINVTGDPCLLAYAGYMDPAQALVSSRGVQYVTLHRIAALEHLGLLPPLPINVRDLNLHGRERDPSHAELIPLEWAVAGNPFQPSAVMAIRTHYDYAYSSDVLEVVHVAGKRAGVIRLLKYAMKIAALYNVPVTGEIDLPNKEMARVLHRLGCRPERVRFTSYGKVSP